MINKNTNNNDGITDGINGEIIVCFGYGKWKECKDDQEIMILLSKHNKIFYVEPQESFVKKGWITNIKSLFHATQKQDGSNYWVLTVSRLPILIIPYFPRFINGFNFLLINYINKKLLGYSVKRYIERLDLNPTMVWIYNPVDFPAIDSFDKQLIIYRVFDEVSLLSSNKSIKTEIEQIENIYIKRVDLIFASSKKQFKNRNTKHPHTYFIPQAVNFKLFNSALKKDLSRPDDLPNTHTPIIGFIGGIDYRIDFAIIKNIAEQHPEWAVLMIGPVKLYVRDSLKLVDEIPNVHFLDEKKQKEIPRYLKFIDISIIPYFVNESTSTMYIGKLHEHLAAGKPIVSTNLPELMPFKDIISIASRRGKFIKCIEEELQTDNQEKIKKRAEVARENKWENRINEMYGIIKNWRQGSCVAINS